MKKYQSVACIGLLLFGVLGASFFVFLRTQTEPEEMSCTMEAMICPDGSAVGRTGPNCEFALCPSLNAENTGTAGIQEKITMQGISVTPLEVIEDSRCPVDVTCVWAGTVRVRVKLEAAGAREEVVLPFGDPVSFADAQVELKSVSPVSYLQKQILPEEYRFEFIVTDHDLSWFVPQIAELPEGFLLAIDEEGNNEFSNPGFIEDKEVWRELYGNVDISRINKVYGVGYERKRDKGCEFQDSGAIAPCISDFISGVAVEYKSAMDLEREALNFQVDESEYILAMRYLGKGTILVIVHSNYRSADQNREGLEMLVRHLQSRTGLEILK